MSAIFHASAPAAIASAFTLVSSVVNASLTASCVVLSNDHANFVTSAISLLISPKLHLDALTASTAASHWKDILSPLLKAVSRHDALSVAAASYCPSAYSLCGQLTVLASTPALHHCNACTPALTPATTPATVAEVSRLLPASLRAIFFLHLLISSFIHAKFFLSSVYFF